MSDAFKPLLAKLADGATLTEEDANAFFAAHGLIGLRLWSY